MKPRSFSGASRAQAPWPVWWLAAILVFLAASTSLSAATYTVTSSDDAGTGTLRQAIIDANATALVADTIEFDTAITTTTLASALPAITDQLTIDGTANHPVGTRVEIDGAGVAGPGLTVSASDCVIKGLFIHGFTGSGGHGVEVTAPNVIVSENTISGNGGDGINATVDAAGLSIYANIVGLDPTGTTAYGNAGDGIDSAANNTIIGSSDPFDRNIVSANGGDGVGVAGSDDTVWGNYIGTDATGLVAHSNNGSGIRAWDTATNLNVGGNVIAGNQNSGISAAATGLAVLGNKIGVGADGSTPIGNTPDGIFLETTAAGAVIGSASPGDRNVISGNEESGIAILAPNTIVQGNYIGLDAGGTLGLGNGDQAIWIDDTATSSVIGGAAPGEGNAIAGAQTPFHGMVIVEAANTQVAGNTIGTNAAGTATIPGATDGVEASAPGVTVGGPTPAHGNLIAGRGYTGAVVIYSDHVTVRNNILRDNQAAGVILYDVTTFVANAVYENSIHDNAGIAIGMGWFGPLSNDPVDADSGGNRLQNHPVLDPVRPADTQLTGVLSSAPSSTYRLDFYRNGDCHPTGYGEAKDWIGTTDVTTNTSGTATLVFALPSAAIVGESFTATATDQLTSDTSGISRCVPVEADPLPDAASIARNAGYPNPTSGPTVGFDISFDEPVTGVTTADFAVSQTGTLTSSTLASVTTPFGNALALDRADSFICPAGNIDLSYRSFTIEYWANRAVAEGGTDEYPFAYYSSSSPNSFLHLGLVGGYAFRFGFYDNELDTLVEWGLTNTWEHWAATFDNDTLDRRVYRNGVLVAQDVADSALVTSGTLVIGSNPLGNFAGKIDEVRVWGVARTQAEIEANLYTPATGSEPNLLALYQFEAIQDLGVNADGADDIADGVAGRHLDQTAGTSSIVVSTVPVLDASAVVNVGTGSGFLGLAATGTGTAVDDFGLPLNPGALSSQTFSVNPGSAVADWMVLGQD